MRLKHFLSVFLTLLTLAVGQMWGGVSSLTFTSACGGSGTADDNVAWTISSDAAESTFDSNRGVHYGTGSKSVSYIQLQSGSFSKKITKIEVEAAGSNTPSITVTVGGNTFGTTATSITNSNVKYTFQPTDAQIEAGTDFKGVVIVRLAKASKQNGALYIKSVAVTYQDNVKVNVTLNRNGNTEIINEVLTGTALDNIDGDDAQGGCSAWEFIGWSKTQRASQNNTTAMTLVTEVDDAGPYYAVYRHSEGGGSDTKTFNFSYTDWGKNAQFSGTTYNEVSQSGSGITVTYSRNNSNLYANSTSLRFYQNNTLTFDAGSKTITAISFTGSVGQSDITTNVTTCTNTSSSLSWAGSASSVTFTRTGSSYATLSSATVTFSSDTYYYSTTATCCTELASINGSVSTTIVPTQNSVTIEWDNVSGASNWAVACKQGGSAYAAAQVGAITNISSNTRKQCTISNLAAGNAYTFTISADLAGYCTSSVSEDVAGSTAAAYTITAGSNNTDYGTVSLSGTTITATLADYCRYATPAYTVVSGTATVEQGTGENVNKFYVTPSANCSIRINFEPIPVTGVTMSSNAETLEVGGSVTLTATVAPNTVNPNVTWQSSNTNIATVDGGVVTAVAAGSATITATSVGDNTKSATCAITVVPVVEYKKVTAELDDWSGEYLLVYENSASEAYVWTGVDAGQCYATATISNSKITKPANGVKLTVEALTGDNEGKYSLKVVGGTNNGKYVGRTTTGNGLNIVDDVLANTISYSTTEGNVGVVINSGQSTTMRFNSATGASNLRFRYYGSGQQPVQLYRKVVTSAVTITDPATGTGSLALADGETPVADGVSVDAGTELTVTATPNSGNHYIGGTVTVTKTVGGDDVTAKVYNSSTKKITMPEYAITVSATFTPTYAINKVAEGGSIALSYTAGGAAEGYAIAGTAVTATATADGSHTFTSIAVSENAISPSISENVATFTMPASAVTVTAEFAIKYDPSISVTDGTNPITSLNFGSVAKGSTPVAQTFKLSGLHLEEGTLTIESSDDEVFTVSPTSIDVDGTLEETTITVTPITDNVGTFNDEFIYIHGGGLAQEDEATIELSLTVQQTYTANWIVNGDTEHPVKSITAVQGAELTFPAEDPSATGDCEGLVFQGWKIGAIEGTASSEPSYVNPENATMPVDGVNYYAVFAEGSSGDETESVTWSTIYDEQTDVEGQELAIGASAKVTFNKGTNSNKCQYYTTGSAIRVYGGGNFVVSAPGTITSITLTFGSGDNNNEITANVGTYSDGSWTGEANSVTFSIGGTSNHRRIAGISVTYSASSLSGWVTTCPHCDKVTLQKVIAGEGAEAAGNAIAFSPASTTVKTCEAAEVTIVPTKVTGWEVSYAISDLEGASLSGNTISLDAETDGELTVTATFSQKNYSIAVETYPAEIGAELGGATSAAKYNEVQTISTNEPTGYIFGGWYMFDASTFDAEDIDWDADLSSEIFTGTYEGGDYEMEASFLMPDKNLVAVAIFDEVHNVAWALENTPSSGTSDFVYVKGIVTDITEIETTQYYNATYYISDLDENGEAVNSFEVFHGKNVGNTNFTNANQLTIGDEVIVYGKLKTYSTVKEFDGGNYIITNGRTAASVDEIVISGGADKVDYYASEPFEYAGLSARAIYNTGYQKDVTAAATWKANDEAEYVVSTDETLQITATWSDVTSDEYPVEVNVTTKVLESIEVAPAALTGYKGIALPKPTTVTAHFDDLGEKSTSNVTALAIYDQANVYDAASTSEQTIEVKYTFGLNTRTANYTVTLSPIVNELASAYSVAKAKEIIDIDRAEGNDLDLELAANKVYVTGVVTSKSGSDPYTIQIKDNTTDEAFLELYKCTLGTNVTGVQVGDVVKAYGNLKWFASLSKYELDEGGQVVAVARTPNFTIADVAEMEVNITADLAEADLTIERGGSEGAITFSCSDPAVTIVGNKLHAAAEGNATVTATIAASGEGAMSFAETSTTFDVHVIAERQRYAVTCDGNGADGGSAPVVANQLPNVTVELPANTFTKTDMRFTGWVVTNNSTSEVIAQEDGHFTMPEAAVTLTAQWEAKTYCALTLRINGVDQTPFDVERLAANDLSGHNPEAINGYEFYGWAVLDSDVEEDVTEAITILPNHIFTPAAEEETKTLYAVFKKAESGENQHYILNYSDIGSAALGYGNATDIIASDGSEWVVKAHKNAGMQINSGKNSSIKIPNCPADIISIAVTGSAQAVGFSASDYSGSGSITYIVEGTDVASQTLDFAGLHVNEGYIVPNGGVNVITRIDVEYNGNFTYYTTRPVVRYTVTFNANGGANAPATLKTDLNSKVRISPFLPTKDEKLFNGWNTEEGGTGTAYLPGAIYTLANNLILYAQWRDPQSAELPEEAIAPLSGKFIYTDKGDTAVFSRGNLRYNYGADQWYTAEHQYDVLADVNLNFGKPEYTGDIDLFGWSNSKSNYGRLASNFNADYLEGGDFKDWGELFEGETEWRTFSKAEWEFLFAHQQWTMVGLIEQPSSTDTLFALAVFPADWDKAAHTDLFANNQYKIYDEQSENIKTILYSEWPTVEALGVALLPTGGARAGHWGNRIGFDGETETSSGNSAAGNWYDWVDNVSISGYYWLSSPSATNDTVAAFLFLPAERNIAEKGEPEDWQWAAPAVWHREKRRGNAVRLITRIPRRYTVTYNANGGTGDVPTDENTYLDGAKVTVAGKGNLAKEGYAFAGWKFKEVTYKAEDKYTIADVLYNENIVFEAQWSEPSPYVLVTKATQLAAGDQIIIAAAGNYDYAMGEQNGDIRSRVEIAKTEDKKRICLLAEDPVVFTLGVSGDYFTFYEEGKGYLCATTGSNKIGTQTDLNDNGKWAISVSTDDKGVVKASVVAQGTYSNKTLQYNSGSPRFSCYGSATQQAVSLYKIPRPVVVPENGSMDASDIATNTSVTVENGATLAVDEDNDLDNLTVEAGGTVSGDEKLTVNNLIIKTTLSTITSADKDDDIASLSGQIALSNDDIEAQGDVFIEITLTQLEVTSGWYAFSVPFPVSAAQGIYYGNTQLTRETDYAIMAYHEELRAAGQYAWKKYYDIMRPGQLYIIAVGDTDYKTLLFKKEANADIVASNSVAVSNTAASGQGQSGWNGLGNPNQQIAQMDGDLQFLDHENNCFHVRLGSETSLSVGSAFMYQYTGSEESIVIEAGTGSGALLAPAREPQAFEKATFRVKLINEATGKAEDIVYLRTSEEATNTYEIGRDLGKMSMGTAKCAQMSIPAYGTQLCIADFPLVNNQVAYPLSINTPKAGTYSLFAPNAEDADIYLTYEDAIIWNLSESAYTIDLTKGTTTGYGLLLKAKMPQTPTGIENGGKLNGENGVQKVIIDENVFILRGGKMYDVTGKAVK